jgi:hypothetical protein
MDRRDARAVSELMYLMRFLRRRAQQIAFQLIDQALRWQVPFNVILADAGYGRNASFLRMTRRAQTAVCLWS